MKIYLLSRKKNSDYAEFSHVGTWTDGEICKKCGRNSQRLIEPLLVEWDIGSSKIGHFSWCGFTAIIEPEVRIFFSNKDYSVKYGLVQMREPSDQKKKQSRVPWPYTGPEMTWLLLVKDVPLNENASNVHMDVNCELCGEKLYNHKRESLIIDRGKWNGEKMFYISQYRSYRTMYVTEEGRKEMITAGFTNVEYAYVGDIV